MLRNVENSFHCGGNTLVSMGSLNSTNYSVVNASDVSGLFVLGIDLESYSGRSGALLSGISTLGSDLIYSANYAALPAAVFDFFMHYDMKLIIQDGILTVHV